MTMLPGFDGGPGFNDGKDPGALRTIGEVTRALGIRQHVLRYWEEQFPMLKPVKRSGGRRYYRPEDVALVAEIDRLVHREGYTLRGARLALEGRVGTKATSKAADREVVAVPAAAPPQAGIVASAGAHSMVAPGDHDLTSRLRAVRDGLAAALAEA